MSPNLFAASAWIAGSVLAAADVIARGGTASLAIRGAIVVGGLALGLGLLQSLASPLLRAACAALRAHGWRPEAARGVMAAVLSAPLWAWLSVSASAGRRLASSEARPLLVVTATIIATLSTFVLSRAIWRQRPGRLPVACWPAAAVCLAAVAGVLLWIDATALTRRYSWFHVALQLAAFAFAQCAVVAALDGLPAPLRASPRWWAAFPLTILLVVLGWQSAKELWSPRHEEDRAFLFSTGGIAATVLDRVRSEDWHGKSPVPAPREAATFAHDLAGGPGLFAGSNVLLITVDALRADHLGLYGYSRATSPRLDALARRSVVFERAYTHSPHTSYALASLMTGRHAFALGRAGLLDGLPTLADAFRAARYRTVGIYPPAVFFVEGERFRDLEKRRYGFAEVRHESLEETRDAVVRTDQALEAFARAGKDPVFMWVHHFGPHEPYVEHASLGPEGRFGGREVDRYDQEIAWVDREIGRLIDGLQHHPRPTVVIVTADHGEEFGEHGGAYHGTSLYDEQVRVPLIVHLPGVAGRRVTTPVSTVDLVPTVVGLVGLSWTSPVDGVDRGAEALGTARPTAASSHAVFCELETWKAVVLGGRKLICDLARDYCRLFDLIADPGERHDLASRRRGDVRELRAELERWLRNPVGRVAGGGEKPGWGPDIDLAAQRGDRTALALVAARLSTSTEDVTLRRRAGQLLARRTPAEHRRALEAAWTSDPDRIVRLWSGIALLLMGDRRPLSLVLETSVTGEADPELGAYRGLALQAIRHESAVVALAGALGRIEDVNLRCRMLAALGQVRSREATAALVAAYPHIRSRICVADALGRDPGAIPFMRERLRDESYTTVRAALARALGRTGDVAALTAVSEAFLRDPEDAVVAAAARAMADLGAATQVRRGRSLQPPPAAKELWLVTSREKGPLRVVLSSARRSRRSDVDTTVVRDAYAFVLPIERPISVRVSRPARYALFR